MTIELSPLQRKTLKASAHALQPVVFIGDKGLTAAVLKEIDVNLESHELIKVRVLGDDREHRSALLAQICESLAAAPVQHIGKILILWRERKHQDEPVREEKAPRRRAPNRRTVSGKSSAAVAPGRRPAGSAQGRPRSPRRAR